MTVLTKYAYSWYFNNGWTTPDNVVGAADGSCAICFRRVDNRLKVDFDFSSLPDGAILDTVYINVKGSIHTSPEKLGVYIYDAEENYELYYIQDIKPSCGATVWQGPLDIMYLLNNVNDLKNCHVDFWYSTDYVPPGALPWSAFVDAVKITVTYHLPPHVIKPSIDGLVTIVA